MRMFVVLKWIIPVALFVWMGMFDDLAGRQDMEVLVQGGIGCEEEDHYQEQRDNKLSCSSYTYHGQGIWFPENKDTNVWEWSNY